MAGRSLSLLRGINIFFFKQVSEEQNQFLKNTRYFPHR